MKSFTNHLKSYQGSTVELQLIFWEPKKENPILSFCVDVWVGGRVRGRPRQTFQMDQNMRKTIPYLLISMSPWPCQKVIPEFNLCITQNKNFFKVSLIPEFVWFWNSANETKIWIAWDCSAYSNHLKWYQFLFHFLENEFRKSSFLLLRRRLRRSPLYKLDAYFLGTLPSFILTNENALFETYIYLNQALGRVFQTYLTVTCLWTFPMTGLTKF